MRYTKLLCLLIVLLAADITALAQRSIRIGYIDMDYILENVPEYQEAQTQLDAKVNQWKADIEKRMNEIEQMKTSLDNERVLLTQELIDERKEVIAFLENEALDYQQKRFGPGGDLMIQRSNLVEPVQDQVFNAVQEISKNKKYDFIFDKSADLVMLYAAERHDVSDQVLLSINRASRRTQVNNRSDREELERSESRDVDQEREVMEREAEEQAQREERDSIINARKAEREAQRDAKQKAFEERRARILAEREQKRDSILKARQNRNNTEDDDTTQSLSPEERRQQILEARARRRDSILEVRQKRKDSLQNARNSNRPPSVADDGGDDN